MKKPNKEMIKYSLIACCSALFLALIGFESLKLQLFLMLSLAGILIWASYKYKKDITQELLIAFLIALAWVGFSGIYTYTEYYQINNINIFPVVGWTFGLVLLREIYEASKSKYRFYNCSALYITFLLIIEYIGYNLINIKIQPNGLPGLFGLPVLHIAPLFQVYYLIAGPLYLKITDFLKVK